MLTHEASTEGRVCVALNQCSAFETESVWQKTSDWFSVSKSTAWSYGNNHE